VNLTWHAWDQAGLMQILVSSSKSEYRDPKQIQNIQYQNPKLFFK